MATAIFDAVPLPPRPVMPCRARSVVPCLAVLLLGARPSLGQGPAERPEDFTARYITTLQNADFGALVSLMHPDGLRMLRLVMQSLLELPGAAADRQRHFGTRSIAAVRALSDSAITVAALRAAVHELDGFAEVLRTSRVYIVGHVPHGHDSVHVVYRMSLAVEGIDFAQMDVITVRRFGETWRAMPQGFLTGLEAAVRRRSRRA